MLRTLLALLLLAAARPAFADMTGLLEGTLGDTGYLIGKADNVLVENARVLALDLASPVLEAIARPVAAANRAIADLREFASLRQENARLREENRPRSASRVSRRCLEAMVRTVSANHSTDADQKRCAAGVYFLIVSLSRAVLPHSARFGHAVSVTCVRNITHNHPRPGHHDE